MTKHQMWKLHKLTQFLESLVKIVAQIEAIHIIGAIKKFQVTSGHGQNMIIVLRLQILPIMAITVLTAVKNAGKATIGATKMTVYGAIVHLTNCTKRRYGT